MTPDLPSFTFEIERLHTIHPERTELQIAAVLSEVWELLASIHDPHVRLATAAFLARQRLSAPVLMN